MAVCRDCGKEFESNGNKTCSICLEKEYARRRLMKAEGRTPTPKGAIVTTECENCRVEFSYESVGGQLRRFCPTHKPKQRKHPTHIDAICIRCAEAFSYDRDSNSSRLRQYCDSCRIETARIQADEARKTPSYQAWLKTWKSAWYKNKLETDPIFAEKERVRKMLLSRLRRTRPEVREHDKERGRVYKRTAKGKLSNKKSWHIRRNGVVYWEAYKILKRDGADCVSCGAPATTIDHIIPVAYGRAVDWDWDLIDRMDNFQNLCQPCHDKKTYKEDIPTIATVKRMLKQGRYPQISAYLQEREAEAS